MVGTGNMNNNNLLLILGFLLPLNRLNFMFSEKLFISTV